MKIRYVLAGVSAAGLCTFSAGTALASPSGVPFKSSGQGTEVPGASGCQFTGSCTVGATGTAMTSHLGSGPYTSSLTIDYTRAFSNGDGGSCAPASGSGTITAANGDTLDQTETGTVCEVGHTGLNVPHTFRGTYTNTGGTGRFASASGGGTVNGSDDGSGNTSYQETGTISY